MYKFFCFLVLSYISTSIASGQAVKGKLLGTWSDSTLVGSNAYDNTYNEIWGVAVNGKEYAIIGSTFGTHFIDITDPTKPTEAHVIEGGTAGPVIIHRDYHDHNGFLYAVADEGSQSTLQILDLSFLPDSVPVVYDSKEYIRRSHNIFIDSSSSILYSCISDGDLVNQRALRLFDISNPYQPTIISDFSTIDGFFTSQVHDAFVIQDTAYLNCGPFGFVMADFSDPVNPISLASLTPFDYPQSGYNHSGWLSEDRKTYYMADEDWDMDIKVIDVTQLPELPVVDTIDAGTENRFSIPHNQVVSGNYLYSSYYYDGLQVWDIADPKNITRVMHFPTSKIEPRDNYEGAWGVYPFLPSGNILISDMQEGLFILEPTNQTVSRNKELETALANSWSVYPNPANGQFSINTDKEINNSKIELINTNGEFIQKLQQGANLLKNIEAGQYFIRLSEGTISTTKTLIIVH